MTAGNGQRRANEQKSFARAVTASTNGKTPERPPESQCPALLSASRDFLERLL